MVSGGSWDEPCCWSSSCGPLCAEACVGLGAISFVLLLLREERFDSDWPWTVLRCPLLPCVLSTDALWSLKEDASDAVYDCPSGEDDLWRSFNSGFFCIDWFCWPEC